MSPTPPMMAPPDDETRRFLALSVLIGTCAGLLVVCFHVAIDLTTWWTADLAGSPWQSVLVPAAGAGLAATLVRYAAPNARGSGIVRTKAALYASDGYIPASAAPGKFVACTLSIGTGTPLGPEDPSLLMGAGLASLVGRWFGLSRPSMRQIAPVGAAAGLAAAFNTPITGVLFVIEEVIASWHGTVLGSVVLAAVSAVVTSRIFLGDSPLFRVPQLTGIAGREVVMFAALGLGAGVVAALYVRTIVATRGLFPDRHSRRALAGPLLAGLVIGAAGLWTPDALGPGYHGIDSALHGQYSAATLATVGAVKLALVLLAFGTGVPGGLFAPTLAVGAMLGGLMGVLAPAVVPFPVGAPAIYVLAGMGAFFAGVFRAPMTAIFMVFELSATYVVIVPAMIASSVGYLVARALQPASLLEVLGREEGAALPSAQDRREREPLRVEHAMRPAPVLEWDTPVALARAQADASRAIVRTPAGTWARVDAAMLAGPDDHGDTVASRCGGERLLPLYPDDPLDAALRRLAAQPVVPVVSRIDPSRLLGAVTLDDVHRAYGLPAGGR